MENKNKLKKDKDGMVLWENGEKHDTEAAIKCALKNKIWHPFSAQVNKLTEGVFERVVANPEQTPLYSILFQIHWDGEFATRDDIKKDIMLATFDRIKERAEQEYVEKWQELARLVFLTHEFAYSCSKIKSQTLLETPSVYPMRQSGAEVESSDALKERFERLTQVKLSAVMIKNVGWCDIPKDFKNKLKTLSGFEEEASAIESVIRETPINKKFKFKAIDALLAHCRCSDIGASSTHHLALYAWCLIWAGGGHVKVYGKSDGLMECFELAQKRDLNAAPKFFGWLTAKENEIFLEILNVTAENFGRQVDLKTILKRIQMLAEKSVLINGLDKLSNQPRKAL